MGELDGEGGEEDKDKELEGAVELAGVGTADKGRVVLEGAVEEEELAKAVAPEEDCKGEKRDGSEARLGDLGQPVEGNRGRTGG